ncbi:glycosyltransferase family 2 protein [Glaciihabitans sp. UYNi722]|uniref:glycosyltransferase family 2 protein n=1 Tax=Glaciihabitans sp. UYNi722 TaxID=3156344 RepID=UPI003394AA7D
MQARVTAILVARSGAAYLERTLAGLARQTRQPDAVIAVDAGSTDNSSDLLAASGPAQLVSAPGGSFGSAVSRAIQVAAPAASDNEWFWLLAHDNAPAPTALEQLLGAVEIAPSVAIAGPKLMRWDQPDVIAEFGETITQFGASIPLVEGELDQAQHDVQDDVLGVAAGGMLVRRSLWTALGGFDPGLPSIDAALDFSIRARLAGFRVVVVPGAKVASAGGPELFGRKSVPDRRRVSIARSAQLHRRLVYSSGGALPFHWLSLLPLAIVRAIGQVIAKRPGAVGGEFATALSTAFGGSGIAPARRNFRTTRTLGWASIALLRMPPAEVRERRRQAREQSAVASSGAATASAPRAGFVTHGGLWVVLVAAVVGVISWGQLLGASSIVGGTLSPLSGTVGELWSHVGYGWREIGVGFVGASDPFVYVIAVLGSITFWAPSFSIVLVYVLAMPLAALGAWFAARRLTAKPVLPVLAAVLWALAPPLLGSLSDGHFGSVIAHLLLPWLVLAALSAARSWAAAAGAALLFAATAASAPVLVPALLLCWLAWMFSRPKSTHRLIGIPIPALALFAPLVVQQVMRGNPLGLLAEPGVPTISGGTSGLRLALAEAGTGMHGWTTVLGNLSLPATSSVVLVAVLLAPVGALAILALFVPGSRRAIPSMVIALLGFATAVIGTHIEVAAVGAVATPIWAGAGLSLFWLGLLGSVVIGLDALGRASVPLGLLAGVTSVLLALPLLGTVYLGTAVVHAGGRILPAVVTAQAEDRPRIGTLVLTAQPAGGLSAVIARGTGTSLDDRSTLASTVQKLNSDERQLARMTGNLASRSGYDAASDLRHFSIGFVLLSPADKDRAAYARSSDALDSNSLLTPVGNTDNGLLWRYQGLPKTDAAAPAGNTETPLGSAILIGQAIIFGLTLLLGIPTARRRRRTAVSGSVLEGPAGTFDEDDHD